MERILCAAIHYKAAAPKEVYTHKPKNIVIAYAFKANHAFRRGVKWAEDNQNDHYQRFLKEKWLNGVYAAWLQERDIADDKGDQAQ